MMKWKKLKQNQYQWLKNLLIMWCACTMALLLMYIGFRKEDLLIAFTIVLGVGALCTVIIRIRLHKRIEVSHNIETFIRENSLYESHYAIRDSLFGPREVECIDYYPLIEYREVKSDNRFSLRIRLDGNLLAEKFRNKEIEQALADKFYTICTEKIEERGYLTYCFELQEQEQATIQSQADIPHAREDEIVLSPDIVWNWKKCPHCLLVGNTGTGKTYVAQYIISCLLEQGVRVIYCDPKNDDDMRWFSMDKSSVKYVTKENDIARVVRETEEEVRLREQELHNIGIKEAEFNPIFLFFDELIAFSKIAEKKTYEETAKRLSTIVVTGRSKRVYTCMILQRPDTSFVEGAIRDNLSCRICMGQMSDTAYKMAFGSDFADVKNHRREIGSGLIYRQGIDTKPREFIAPFICEGALSN